MNWNALEWDRAAEELTWERVRPVCHILYVIPKSFRESSSLNLFFPFLFRCLGLMGPWFSW